MEMNVEKFLALTALLAASALPGCTVTEVDSGDHGNAGSSTAGATGVGGSAGAAGSAVSTGGSAGSASTEGDDDAGTATDSSVDSGPAAVCFAEGAADGGTEGVCDVLPYANDTCADDDAGAEGGGAPLGVILLQFTCIRSQARRVHAAPRLPQEGAWGRRRRNRVVRGQRRCRNRLQHRHFSRHRLARCLRARARTAEPSAAPKSPLLVRLTMLEAPGLRCRSAKAGSVRSALRSGKQPSIATPIRAPRAATPAPTDSRTASFRRCSRRQALDPSDARRIVVVEPTRPPFPWAEPYLTVGTTGTNGKTSTTLLVAHALRAAGRLVLAETTLGYRFDDEELDVPRTATGFYAALEGAAKRGARHAAIEVTSEALAKGFAKRWRFDIGVFTNLTRDHLDAHGSWEHYLASKAQLFAHLPPGGAAVLNGCDEVAPLLI